MTGALSAILGNMRPTPPRAAGRLEPMFNIPSAVLASIGLLLIVQGARSFLPAEADFRLLLKIAFIPGQWTLAWDPAKSTEALRHAATHGSVSEAVARSVFARFVLSDPNPAPWSVVTYALFHGSWTHVLVNSLWLAAFGTPLARRCGPVRYVLLALGAAVGGAAAHWIAHPLSAIPMVGASASVSGMMAAAARFVFAGSSRRDGLVGSHLGLRQSLVDLVKNTRAAAFLGLWFATNLLFGVAVPPLGVADASIAWEAHIGGFLVGLLLFPLLDQKRVAVQ